MATCLFSYRCLPPPIWSSSSLPVYLTPSWLPDPPGGISDANIFVRGDRNRNREGLVRDHISTKKWYLPFVINNWRKIFVSLISIWLKTLRTYWFLPKYDPVVDRLKKKKKTKLKRCLLGPNLPLWIFLLLFAYVSKSRGVGGKKTNGQDANKNCDKN